MQTANAVGMLLVYCWYVVGILLVCCWYVVGILLVWFVGIVSSSQNFGTSMLLQVWCPRCKLPMSGCLVCCWYVVGMLFSSQSIGSGMLLQVWCQRCNSRPATSTWGFCCHLMWPTCLWECSAAFHTSLYVASCYYRISTAGLRGCTYYYQCLSCLSVLPTCTNFSRCCYLPASKRNKHRPRIVATLK